MDGTNKSSYMSCFLQQSINDHCILARKNTAIFVDEVTTTLANLWKRTSNTKERLCPIMFVCKNNFLIVTWFISDENVNVYDYCFNPSPDKIQNILQIFCWCFMSRSDFRKFEMDALTLMSCFNKTAIFILYKIGKLKVFNLILGNLIWIIAYFNQHLSAAHSKCW